MSDLDAAVQIVKLEIDSMNYVFRVVGTTGIEIMKAFAKMIKKLGGMAVNSHREKKLDEIRGSVSLKDFRKKYTGDDVMLIELKDADTENFLDMCRKEGVAVTKLPDLDFDDGYSQFMVAASTMQTIKFNFEKINRWHMENGGNQETDKEDKGNTEDKREDDGNQETDKEDKGNPADKKEKNKESGQYECGREISAIDYVHTAKGDTEAEKEEAFKKAAEDLFPGGSRVENVDLSNEEQIKRFIANATDDQRLLLAEQNGYECFPIREDMIIGEDSRSIAFLAGDGEQVEVDKSLVFSREGKTRIYCPTENHTLGDVKVGGESINADVLKNKMSPQNSDATRTGVTEAVNRETSHMLNTSHGSGIDPAPGTRR